MLPQADESVSGLGDMKVAQIVLKDENNGEIANVLAPISQTVGEMEAQSLS